MIEFPIIEESQGGQKNLTVKPRRGNVGNLGQVELDYSSFPDGTIHNAPYKLNDLDTLRRSSFHAIFEVTPFGRLKARSPGVPVQVRV